MSKHNKPQKVTTALTLLWLALAIGIAKFIIVLSGSPNLYAVDAPAQVFTSVISLLVLAALVFLISMIGQGKNWARIVYLVLFVASVSFSFIPTNQSLALYSVWGTFGLTQAALQTVALIFLFQKPSSVWFK